MVFEKTLVLTKKQQFTKHINGKIRQINIKNQTYSFTTIKLI